MSIKLTKLPIDAVPDITNNQVQVITYTECSSESIGSGGLTGGDFIVQFTLRDEGGNLETDIYLFA